MPVVRALKDRDFTVMRTQHLRDTRLSLKAIGLFSIILSLPPEWDFSIAGLAAITKDGIATVRAALNELKANGIWPGSVFAGRTASWKTTNTPSAKFLKRESLCRKNLRRSCLRRIRLRKKSLCRQNAWNIV